MRRRNTFKGATPNFTSKQQVHLTSNFVASTLPRKVVSRKVRLINALKNSTNTLIEHGRTELSPQEFSVLFKQPINRRDVALVNTFWECLHVSSSDVAFISLLSANTNSEVWLSADGPLQTRRWCHSCRLHGATEAQQLQLYGKVKK
jgi:hypothetical protein